MQNQQKPTLAEIRQVQSAVDDAAVVIAKRRMTQPGAWAFRIVFLALVAVGIAYAYSRVTAEATVNDPFAGIVTGMLVVAAGSVGLYLLAATLTAMKWGTHTLFLPDPDTGIDETTALDLAKGHPIIRDAIVHSDVPGAFVTWQTLRDHLKTAARADEIYQCRADFAQRAQLVPNTQSHP